MTDETNPFVVGLRVERFMESYNIQITLKKIDKWRVLYPNVGQLDGFPHFGNVFIIATDGILAYYHVDCSGQLFLGHLKAFNGPIAKEFVNEADWDYERRCRKVNVFKREDGSIVVIPQDVFWDAYWSKHPRMTKEEHSIFAEVGHSIHADQVDEELKKLYGESRTFNEGEGARIYKPKNAKPKTRLTLEEKLAKKGLTLADL